MGFSFLGSSRRPHLTPSAALLFGLVVGASLGLIFFTLSHVPASDTSFIGYRAPISVSAVSLQPSVDASFIERAFSSASSYTIAKRSRILLIPHHLVASREIAGALSAFPDSKRIVLLAPDHLGVGKTSVTVGDGTLSFFDQRIPSDSGIANAIVSAYPQARMDESAIANELSVQALLPFLAKAFPRASITPILIQIGNDRDARQPIADALTKLLNHDSNILLVSTVDFSHYLPSDIADFHDVLAQDVIRGLADLEADRVELDSAGVLAATLRCARELGLGNVSVLAHTNSLRILESKLSQESTSHIIASFAPGAISKQKDVTMLFFGDLMFDREVENRMSRSNDPLFPFSKLAGAEQRLFKGQDAVIANLEGPLTDTYRAPEKENDFAFDARVGSLLKQLRVTIVSQANNHTLDQGREGALESRSNLEKNGIAWIGDQVQYDPSISLKRFEIRGQSVAMLAFNAVGIPFDREAAEVALKQASTSTHRIVFMHWGNEYQAEPSTEQVAIGHWLIEHGADVVIGSHPHWMQGIEVYKGKPIAYSLGNAVFDQDWSTETQFGLSVGLVLKQTGFELHLFPIQILKSVPSLLDGELRQTRLDRLAEISDASLRDQIRSGVVKR